MPILLLSFQKIKIVCLSKVLPSRVTTGHRAKGLGNRSLLDLTLSDGNEEEK